MCSVTLKHFFFFHFDDSFSTLVSLAFWLNNFITEAVLTIAGCSVASFILTHKCQSHSFSQLRLPRLQMPSCVSPLSVSDVQEHISEFPFSGREEGWIFLHHFYQSPIEGYLRRPQRKFPGKFRQLGVV